MVLVGVNFRLWKIEEAMLVFAISTLSVTWPLLKSSEFSFLRTERQKSSREAERGPYLRSCISAFYGCTRFGLRLDTVSKLVLGN